MNLEIEQFHKDLIQLINNCHLPAGIALFVLKDCYRDVERAYQEMMQAELEDIQNDEVEKEEVINIGEVEEEKNE